MKAWSARPVPDLPGEAPLPVVQDTRLRRRAELPRQERASLYVCGITPYDATHMGHAATYVAFDVLHRAWLDAGTPVDYVQNVTDVDDPLLERAEATGVDWRELAAEQTELFRADMSALNVLPPQHYVGATEAVGWIVPAVEQLLGRGLAYRVPGADGEPDGDVYFDVEAAGALDDDAAWVLGDVSHLTPEQMLPVFAERGGDPERPGKRHPLDPLLWRVERPGEPAWDGASLGPGRPGWHIECALIALEHLPAPFTVQGGGSDLVFPHHEMGAGHCSALTGRPMAEHFLHTGMVGLDGEKMSKSKGNLVLVSRLRAQGVEPAAVRTAILAHRYSDDWSWTDLGLAAAVARLDAWRRALAVTPAGTAAPLLATVRAALADDLDAPAALTALDDWAAGALTAGSAAECSPADAQLVRELVEARLGVVL
ncbi:cysteine--1-D-myo-inosityl 2-amino-2-deoxy-alpha-D-glucopyranoside ligase [Kocuria rosea]|jgi:L-cysteine:1D-myo-inositol 2-amino-2-deoxy-alpha-D-glucopyranoside ligase|uniref:cysteine--1-D-myo-inosityl 2-amino-2-deoxy-alpha-D-glucopyranoside ligase n=1 Tax=Kocuria rosea TaxID=1275 RepID=UPI00203B6CEF|nr:cysteine--1-D-myo-inosityl 2-amino-2-deoxy-alpha-D-glucopyranoside ligase [Kocuria rosea]MCM3688094.1 cysteine--1-D-myo-inosityl 2-amino-2-deoxy-alpha-D-glucopyranoside ligase [Kocuria rosea]HST71356.1 cysteine--1-D-myo-inosityl 2-amino-2-deoxy-alpha-D-glucopyranoside ligase [Kocuria rosea]